MIEQSRESNRNYFFLLNCAVHAMQSNVSCFTSMLIKPKTIAELHVFKLANFLHSPILHYACKSLLTGNNGKNNATAVGLCAVFVVSWWRNKGLHTWNRVHNEVWGCAEI